MSLKNYLRPTEMTNQGLVANAQRYQIERHVEHVGYEVQKRGHANQERQEDEESYVWICCCGGDGCVW